MTHTNKRIKMLVDVDGVVADLMLGFSRWLDERHGEHLDVSKITCFNIPRSPALRKLHDRVDLDRCLDSFLGTDNVYETYVTPVSGAVEALKSLSELVEPVFVTATLKNAPQSYVSKFRWCRERFGDLPMIACPSQLKMMVRGVIGIDDRWDTCERWRGQSMFALLFRAPWNEAPSNEKSHDWPEIIDAVDGIVRRLHE